MSSDGKAQTFLVRRDDTVTENRPSNETTTSTPKPPGVFGPFPLARAVVAGVPLADGTALVAKDGVLGRVSLENGTLLDKHDAFDMRSAQCTPIPLSERTAEPPRWGFVCGEPNGRTAIYALDQGSLRTLRVFARPRAVVSSGEGGLAVRGSCDDTKAADETSARRSHCVFEPKTGFREIVLTGNVGAERVVVLGDGRIVVVSPPALDIATTRITLIDAKGVGKSIPVTFPSASGQVARTLATGVWLDGFEVREKGIGGWVHSQGSMIGVEIGLDGDGRVGELITELGNPIVSGRFGLGFTGSGRGYETTDGGMTWVPVDMPAPISEVEKNPERGCSLLGCRSHGWLRVGWGGGKPQKPAPLPAARAPARPTPSPLVLECEHAAERVPAPGATYQLTPGTSGKIIDTPSELGSFRGLPVPAMKKTDRAYLLDINTQLGRQSLRPEARVVALGPKVAPWDEQNATFAIEWSGPFDARAHTTSFGPAPGFLIDAARSTSGAGVIGRRVPSYYYGGVSIGVSADGKHAFATGRRPGTPGIVTYLLAEDRAPVEAKRGDGEPWLDVDDVVFADRSWFVSTTMLTATAASGPRAPAKPTAPRLSIFRIDGSSAREIAVVKRPQNRATLPTFVHEHGGRRIGILMDGDPTPWGSATLWVTPIDSESGVVGEPELLGAVDLSDVGELSVCDDPARGWMWNAGVSDRRTELVGAEGKKLPASNVQVRVVSNARGTCVQSLSLFARDVPPPAGPLRTRPNTTALRDGRHVAMACHTR